MPCPTVLPATDFSELLGRRVPVVAAPSGDATVVHGVGWDANGGPVWQACLGVQWHPEWLSAADPAMQGIFDAFVAACK